MGPWGRLVENISSRLAFFPPAPPTYEVRPHADGTGELYIHPLAPDVPKVLQCTVKVIPVPPCKAGGGNTQVVTAFFRYGSGSHHSSRAAHHGGGGGAAAAAGGSSSTAAAAASSSASSRLTLLYSHGNAVDLGHMLPVYRELSRLLHVNVMGYDYSGYGCSTGTPTVNNTLADISAVLSCLEHEYGVPASRVVLYGQSVGSGPSCWLGAQRADVGGVVLHSPLLSGVRVLKPHVRWWPAWADVYPNHTLAPRIRAPVLVMHGTEDEVIHISCGQRLHSLCSNAFEPLWAHGYGHQDLEMSAAYLPALEAFLKHVRSGAGAAAAAAAAAAASSSKRKKEKSTTSSKASATSSMPSTGTAGGAGAASASAANGSAAAGGVGNGAGPSAAGAAAQGAAAGDSSLSPTGGGPSVSSVPGSVGSVVALGNGQPEGGPQRGPGARVWSAR